jgi:hypothetical protein
MEALLCELGHVKLAQIRPTRLMIASDKTPAGYFYDGSRLVEVDQPTIIPLGRESLPDRYMLRWMPARPTSMVKRRITAIRRSQP